VRFSGLWGVCWSCPVAVSGLPVRWCMCRETQPLRPRNAPLYRTDTPWHHFCAPDDGGCHSNRPVSWVVQWRGAVSWQKRGKCERNTVLFSPEKQSWGPKGAYDARLCPWLGSDGVNWRASVSPAPVTTRVWAQAALAFFDRWGLEKIHSACQKPFCFLQKN
jgi:hypothetical protein